MYYKQIHLAKTIEFVCETFDGIVFATCYIVGKSIYLQLLGIHGQFLCEPSEVQSVVKWDTVCVHKAHP